MDIGIEFYSEYAANEIIFDRYFPIRDREIATARCPGRNHKNNSRTIRLNYDASLALLNGDIINAMILKVTSSIR